MSCNMFIYSLYLKGIKVLSVPDYLKMNFKYLILKHQD